MYVNYVVHIGSGQKIDKMQYIYTPNDKKIYVMDNAKLFKGLQKYNLIDEYEKLLLGGVNIGGVNKGSKCRNLLNFLEENKIESDEYKSWAKYKYDTTGNDFADHACSDIDGFVKDAYGKPYIPGSSLKGAIRTAILNAHLLEHSKDFSNEKREIEKIITDASGNLKKDLAKQTELIENKITHTAKRDEKNISSMLNDCFCGLRISDSNPVDVSNLTLCKKKDVNPDGYESKNKTEKSKPNVYRECLQPDTELEFSMTIDERYFKYTIEDIEESIYMMYNNYCEKFIACFDDNLPVGDGYIFLGGGAGFVTKTFMYSLFEKEKAIELTSKFMMKTTSTDHAHDKDISEYKVSPHMRKSTKFDSSTFDFGLCYIEFTVI